MYMYVDIYIKKTSFRCDHINQSYHLQTITLQKEANEWAHMRAGNIQIGCLHNTHPNPIVCRLKFDWWHKPSNENVKYFQLHLSYNTLLTSKSSARNTHFMSFQRLDVSVHILYNSSLCTVFREHLATRRHCLHRETAIQPYPGGWWTCQ